MSRPAAKSLILIIALLVCATGAFAQTRTRHETAKKKAPQADSEAGASNEANQGEVIGKRITFADGRTMVVDEAWRQGLLCGITRGGVTQSLTSEVTKIDPVYAPRKTTESTAVNQPTPA